MENEMKHACTVFALALAFAAPASAAPIGPVYPPPTGVTLTNNGGTSGRDAGRTFFYDITDFTQVDQMWWGLVDGYPIGPLGSSTGQVLTFNSIIGGVGAVYDSATPWSINTAFGTVTEPVRLVMNIYDYSLATNLTSSLVSRSSVGIGGSGVVFGVTNDFAVKFQFQAFNGSTWDSVLDVYDNLSTNPSCVSCVVTQTNGGFWYTEPLAPVPEPATLAIFGIGLVGAGVRLKRRSRA
jgi:hypothetical protein